MERGEEVIGQHGLGKKRKYGFWGSVFVFLLV
jgi:hypothetical protein